MNKKNNIFSIVIGVIIILSLLLIALAFYSYKEKDDNKNNQTTNPTSPLNYEYKITINDKLICDSVYCFSGNSHYYWVNDDITEIIIKAQSNDSSFKINTEYNHQLKEGKNLISYGKDLENNEMLNITIYKTNFPSIITDKPSDFEKLNKSVDVYYDSFWVTARINAVMIDADNLDYEKHGGKEIKCARQECQDIKSLTKYIIKSFSTSERLAQEIIDDMIEKKELIIKNNDLYFIYQGGTGVETQLGYKGYFKQDDKIYLLYENQDSLPDEDGNTIELGCIFYMLIKEDGKWVIDHSNYLGVSL